MNHDTLMALAWKLADASFTVGLSVNLFGRDSAMASSRAMERDEAKAALSTALTEVLAERDEHKENAMRNARIALVFRAERDALALDAESWRKYKARKDAVIAAGMGRNPLRESAFDTLPDDYEVN